MINITMIEKELKNKGFDVEVKNVEKNGVKKDGILFRGHLVDPVIYPEEHTYLKDLDSALKTVLEAYHESLKHVKDMADFEQILDKYDSSNVYIAVQPKVGNPKYLTKDFLDLQLYIYVKIDKDHSAKVTRDLVSSWDVSVEEIWEDAFNNTESELIHKNLAEIVFGSDVCEDTDFLTAMGEHTQYVLTNKSGFKGASFILFTDSLFEIYEKYGNDFYIIPSSIHELLTLPGKDATPDEVRRMIKEVNDTEVSPEERLSYNVYKYDHVLNAVVML